MASSSTFELNDTLQITKSQGFPTVLDIERHLVNPIQTDTLEGLDFSFTDKPGLRNFVVPPVRCFLVENIDGKWLYWGHCHILETRTDYINRTTSGRYRIILLFSPAEIKVAHNIVDRNPSTNYFKL
jgi:hypothetical protein